MTADLDKIRRLEDLQRLRYLQENLPHLYGWKWYPWALAYFNSTNKNCFLVAANQISKSSTQIRKCIDWAIDKKKWPKLWPSTPRIFWYLYPTREVATVEFEEKWVKEFMPRGDMKDDPVYGWEAIYKVGYVSCIKFRSGVSVYFKTYEQGATKLQTASVHAIFCDEELPVELYDELSVRRSSAAIQGYFSMVFTATLGQHLWRETMEEKGKYEKFPDAFKMQVSMYDCLKYSDGSDSPWTVKLIEQAKNNCKSEAEIQRRIYGRFVIDEDLKYPGFARSKNLMPDHKLPKSWLIFTGVDIGSGGAKGHPAAICFVGVNKEFTKGRIFKCKRMDNQATTAGDILLEYKSMKGQMNPVGQFYDYASRDFLMIAQRSSPPEAFQPANKNHEVGEQLVNVLFKNEMLKIYDDLDGEGRKLCSELESCKKGADKKHQRDDLIDAMRYAITNIPWDFSAIGFADKGEQTDNQKKINQRTSVYQGAAPSKSGLDLLVSEMDDFNETLEDFDHGDSYDDGTSGYSYDDDSEDEEAS